MVQMGRGKSLPKPNCHQAKAQTGEIPIYAFDKNRQAASL